MVTGGHVWNLRLMRDVFCLPPTAKTVSQDAIEALEAKRARRLRELGDWRPKAGWKIDPPAGAPAETNDGQQESRDLVGEVLRGR
jgi:hypothetical protein